MKTANDCIPCIVRQALDACRMAGADEGRTAGILPRILAKLAESDLDRPPPVLVGAVHRILRDGLGDPDPYRGLKKRSTEKGLELEPSARRAIETSADPFGAAVRLAIAGNIMDFGSRTSWDEERILASFRMALEKPMPHDATDVLRGRIAAARSVLYLGDNAGEAVFDRLLIERFPGKPTVRYAVRGRPILNDATEEDARDAGIQRVAAIVSNGMEIPGIFLPSAPQEFRSLFAAADVVLSKGQGNFETLNEEGRSIFHLLQIKCESLGRRYGYPLGEWIVVETGRP